MMRYPLASIAIFAMGCSGSVRVVHPQPCVANYSRVSDELLPPRPEHPFMPPTPVPSTVQGREVNVRVVVDTNGRVMRDSIMVCGIQHPLYLQRVAEEVSAMRFRPGLMRAKHVTAAAILRFTF